MIFTMLFTLCVLLPFQTAIAGTYDKNYIGKQETYSAVYEDTFVKIAREHDLGFVEMRSANPKLDPWIPGDGAQIILPKQHLFPDVKREGIVINLPEMRLYYFPDKGAPKTFPIGVGRDGLATPTGRTKIIRKKEEPTWSPTKRMREENPELPVSVPAGPLNPLGTHAMYLGWPQYLIHGTNKPYGIGRRVSSGCIRMYPEDIIKLFALIDVGTPVQVIDQPVKVSWVGGDLYIEAHVTKEDADLIEANLPSEEARLNEKDLAYILQIAGDSAEKLDLESIREVVEQRSGFPVKVFSRKNSSLKTDVAMNYEQVPIIYPAPKP